MASMHDFTMTSITSDQVDLKSFENQVCLVAIEWRFEDTSSAQQRNATHGPFPLPSFANTPVSASGCS